MNFFNLFQEKTPESKKYEDLEKLNHKLRILLEINKSVAKVGDLHKTLDEIFITIEKSLGYKSSLLLVNNQERRLEAYSSSRPVVQGLINAAFGGNNIISVPLDYQNDTDMGLAAKAVKTGEVQLGDSVSEVLKPLVPKLVSDGIQKITGVKRIMVIPIKIKDEVIGALIAGSTKIVETEDIEILSLFGDLAGLALSNSRLFTQTLNQVKRLELKEKQQDIIFRITNQLISTLDPQTVIERSVDIIPKEMGYYGAFVVLHNKKRNTLLASAFTSTPLKNQILGLIGKDYKEKYKIDLSEFNKGNETPVIEAFIYNKITVVNAATNPFSPPLPKEIWIPLIKVLGLKSVVSVPIHAKDQPIGVISFTLTDKTAEEVTQDDLGIMSVFANQLGLALDNANLASKLQKQADQDKALAELGTTAISDIHLESVAQKIVDRFVNMLGAIGGVLSLVDRDETMLQPYVISNTPILTEAIKHLPIPMKKLAYPFADMDNIPLQTVRNGKIYYSTSLYDIIKPAVPEIVANTIQKIVGVNHYVSVPLATNQKFIGSILLGFKEEPTETGDLPRITLFSNLVALAISNSLTFAHMSEQRVQLQAYSSQLRISNSKLESALNELKTLDQAKSEFISIASHQLRTPISIVRGYLSMITDGDFGSVPEEQRVIIEKTQVNVKQLTNIVEDLLNASRIEQGRLVINPQSFDMVESIKLLTSELSQKASKKHLSLVFETELQQCIINADKNKIFEVMMNIVDNSINYTQEGGITVRLEDKGSKILFSVKDTGIGIPKDKQDQIFKRFTRLENAKLIRPDGTGIGLYIAKTIIEAHLGKIWFESEENVGTTFFFELNKELPTKQSENEEVSSDKG